MNAIERTARAATRWLSLLGFAGLFILALMTTIDAMSRWLFSAPLHGVNDVSSVVMAVVIASCIPANLAQRKNISVEVLGAISKPQVARLLRAFSSLVVFVFIALMAWQFVPYAQGMYESGRQTWVLKWPVWPWWSLAALCLIFAAFIQLANLIADLRALFADHSGHAGPGRGYVREPGKSAAERAKG